MITAEIAYRQLSPGQQKHAAEVLQHLPGFSYDIGTSTAGLPADERNHRIFVMASFWPDLVRHGNHPAHSESRPEWHVTWLPLAVSGYKLPAKLAKAGDTNTMEALPVLMNDFATSSGLSMERKAVQLAWILHLVGDLHQPLHAVALYSNQWPAGDNSGSAFHISTREGVPPDALHRFWDAALGTRDIGTTELLAFVDGITSDPLLSRESLAIELGKKSVREWIEESRDIARTDCYLLDTSSPLVGLTPQEARKAVATGAKIPVLPPGYYHHAREVARKRAALAGDRMANYLLTVLPE